jgi:hypothetical protein
LDYKTFLEQTPQNRRGAFGAAAADLGTAPRNVEKDFWICLVLEAIFMDSTRRWPRMAFRGGTSLSKAFSAIGRFSEDIDIAVERADLKIPDTLASLEKLSPAQRQQRLAVFNAEGEAFIAETVALHLEKALDKFFAPRAAGRPKVRISRADRLTIEIEYVSTISAPGESQYIAPTVRLEFSVRSALEPQVYRPITPYVAKFVQDANMTLANVPTVVARRTFWDKILIAHELKDRHSKDLPLTLHNERVSRHYYDLYMLIRSGVGAANKAQLALARECQRYSAIFYPSDTVDICDAVPGSFDIVPNAAMERALANDYTSMEVMIFGAAPGFSAIRDELRDFEAQINAFGPGGPPTR